MNAEINTLYYSNLFTVADFKCRALPGEVSGMEWSCGYSINFTRKGNFRYKLGKDYHDVHSGIILFENAETEYSVSHDHHVKDECTSLYIQECLLCEMAKAFSESAQTEKDYDYSENVFRFPSVAVNSTPEFEYFHRLIYRMTSRNQLRNPLEVDLLIMDFLESVFTALYGTNQRAIPVQLDKKLKDMHLETIDRGKRYIMNNFQKELHLTDIAMHAYVSPFHFSRLFKQITSYSPHQFLLTVRLNHAKMLLRNTSDSVTEIGLESGFNSLEHFIASFKRRYDISPLKFRRCQSTFKNSKIS
jgi:AraC-like DNA-binding protein